MNRAKFRAIRNRAGLSLNQLAVVLGIAAGRTIRRYEDGYTPIPGAVQICMEMMDRGELPQRYFNRMNASGSNND